MVEFVSDGAEDFSGGQDASKAPAKVPPNAYAAGINTSVQDGMPVPRWGYRELALKLPQGFITAADNTAVPYAEIFRAGRYQARADYNVGPERYILWVIGGVIFLFNIRTNEVTVIELPNNDTLNENAARINWSYADRYFVLFDFPNFPVILDGLNARRADPALYEVPTAVLGAYNQNRLFISNAGQEFTGGDPTGSLASPDAPITFEEVLAPASAYLGQVFKLPTNVLNADITAMTFLEFTDSSTGIGPLLISTANQIFSYNTQNPRSTWEQGQFGTVLTSTGGIAGARAYAHVNSDLFYVGTDGQVRTLSMSRDEQKKWARVPISREVQNWLIYNDQSLVKYAVVGYFNNKVLISANPYRVQAFSRSRSPIYDVAFGGFVVLELDNLATLGRSGAPVWAGLWTGVRPMDIVTVDDRCFIISKDPNSRNAIYEIDTKRTYDTDENGNIRYAKAVIYSREFDFQSGSNNKEAHSISYDLMNVKGDFKLTAEYKASHGHRFIEWDTFRHDAPWRSCTLTPGCAANGLAGHSFRDLYMGGPRDKGCDPVSSLRYDFFKKLQIRLTLEGIYWELDGYRVNAVPIPESQQITTCDLYKPVPLCEQCNDDWKVEGFKSCLTQRT